MPEPLGRKSNLYPLKYEPGMLAAQPRCSVKLVRGAITYKVLDWPLIKLQIIRHIGVIIPILNWPLLIA
jgi:hypothetical protein